MRDNMIPVVPYSASGGRGSIPVDQATPLQ